MATSHRYILLLMVSLINILLQLVLVVARLAENCLGLDVRHPIPFAFGPFTVQRQACNVGPQAATPSHSQCQDRMAYEMAEV